MKKLLNLVFRTCTIIGAKIIQFLILKLLKIYFFFLKRIKKNLNSC